MGHEWSEKREEAIERDDSECQDCGISMTEHKKRYKQGLHVHHKVARKQILSDDPTREEFELANSLDNLVTLCASCHRVREKN